jgi:hypothetical protein
MFSVRVDITGQRFGRLTVVAEHGWDRGQRMLYWRCLCDCGGETIASHKNLRSGNTKSCGCLRIEMGKAKTLRHGASRRGDRKKVYGVWATMRARCRYPSQQSYHLYGARGITVCERWQLFDNFYADMGDPPPGYSLDRIDPDGNYEPSNCRWATSKEQRANQRPFDARPRALKAATTRRANANNPKVLPRKAKR